MLDSVAHCRLPSFNVFMNAFIVNVRLQDVGCHVNHQCVRCFLYVDDIILISPSIIGLQLLLVVCSATAQSLPFKFFGNKSHCLSLGKLAIAIRRYVNYL